MITIKINTEGMTSLFNRLDQRVKQREPLMRNIAAIIHDEVEENFNQEGRPKWQGLKYPREGGGKIMQKSGRLISSITEDSNNDESAVGSNLEYAPIQHLGGQTRPHIIKPKRAKALKFNGRFAKSVNHPGSKIPARKIFNIPDDGIERIVESVEDYLMAVVD